MTNHPTNDVLAQRILNRLSKALNDLDRLADEPGVPIPVLARMYARIDRPMGSKGTGIYQALAMVRDNIAERLNREGPPGDFTITGVGTFERVNKGGSTHWQGQRLAHRVAARAADSLRADPSTGEVTDEPIPPAVLAAHVADEIVACAGLDAASKSWRKKDLKARNIDPDEYHTTTGDYRRSIKLT